MAMKHLITIGTMLVVGVFHLNLANAQLDLPGPSFKPKPVESADSTRPFATPGVFNYDAQMFAPLEFPNGRDMGPRSGFFGTYDRLYLSLSKPGAAENSPISAPTGNMDLWGNRYNIGWMSDADDGWSIEFANSEGSFFSAGRDELVSNPMLVTSKFANVEVNKVFRQALSQGGWIEPYVGFRYMYLSDRTLEDTVTNVGGVTINNRFKQEATNSSAGVHVGGRYSNRRGRWRQSLDASIATNYNQQNLFATDISSTATGNFLTEKYDSDNAFMPVFDASYEIGYNLTRDFGLRGGISFVYIWNGLGRANTLSTADNPNSDFGISAAPFGLVQDRAIAAGFNFGFEWRR